MKHISFGRRLFACVLSLIIIIGALQPVSADAAASSYPIIILSQYNASLSVGEEFYLIAVASNGKMPAFKSSSSKIASVSSLGRVTAKQAGTCRITVKVSSSEASCVVTVKKTQITVNSKTISMENGENFQLKVSTSTNHIPTFSSNKKSVAMVDSNGLITACKPGDAVISVKADQTVVTCKVRVKKPTIKLSKLSVSLFRCQQIQLTATVSSRMMPTWKTNKSSVATVNGDGLVTAQKHGTALITAKVDGVTKTCTVEVKSPKIQLESDSLTMSVGETRKLEYSINSGNTPTIKSSKSSVVKVDQEGNLKALSKGTATITFTEDGAKAACKVSVVK